MAEINEAFDVLSSPTKRLKYDQVYKTIVTPLKEDVDNTPTDEEVMIGIMRYVAEEAEKGKKRREIVHDLSTKGVPFDVAASIVNGVFQSRSALKRKAGLKGIGCGLLM